ncbi:MAG: DUF3365 domain-containing protein [Vicinamibacterales bacterium]|nr:DUF3365 domain-containing protein [Vicinamibacterales bacterium]
MTRLVTHTTTHPSTRRAHALLITLAMCPVVLSAAESVPAPEWVAKSRELVAQLGGELKGELTRAVEQGGPVAAIGVCRERAPAIAAGLSQQSGARVSRTALRVRNPANAPDELQRAVLGQFAEQLAAAPAGAAAGPPEAVFEIRGAQGIERRYMRAIPTDALCLTCHGATLSPELAAAVERDYPADEATGFALGELRGAFSVVWPAVPATVPEAKP